ncbi:MAG TPA: hypothetical protein VLA14_05325 [Polyangia bacterium]|jgi:hypothetical protein|nr:hypothetical protein [Polyangia bacterium]
MIMQTASGRRQLSRPLWTLSAGAILGAALFLGSCGTPPGQFVIIQNQVPQSGCVIPGTLSDLYLDSGDLDLSLINDGADTGYLFFPLMQNNAPAPASAGIDPNRIALSEFLVDLSVGADAPPAIVSLFNQPPRPELLKFSVPTSGSVASGGGDTAGSVNAVTAELARDIRSKNALASPGDFFYLTATVRVQGKTLTNTVTSDPFHYPIRVCNGCLAHDLGICPLTQAGADSGDPCNIAQDQPIDCCELGPSLVCPPVVGAQ